MSARSSRRRPSTRLSTTEALPSIAASRSTEPARLAGLLRGELDWIAMKALEKDRARRYETANALARDVQRYLADEVVEARPPAGYRMRKFVRRHKGRVVAASLVLLALVAGIIGTTWGYVRAERACAAEERLAEGERLARLDAQEQKRQAEAANARAQKRLEQIEKGNEVLTGIFSDLNIRMVESRASRWSGYWRTAWCRRPGNWRGSRSAIRWRSRRCSSGWDNHSRAWASLRRPSPCSRRPGRPGMTGSDPITSTRCTP